MTKPLHARIIAAYGRHYMAFCQGQTIYCVMRGKKNTAAVGDFVHLTKTSKDQALISDVLPRNNLLFRSDQYKSKSLASNIDQLFIVCATEPTFSDDLISRALIAAEASQLNVYLILNKIDLTTHLKEAKERLSLYKNLNYPIIYLSAEKDPVDTKNQLMPLLFNKTSILIGQSGMGKSTITNLIVPNAHIATQEFSSALNSGKHTTSFTRMYAIDENSALIDSPGFQEFGLHHLTEGQLERAFREFSPYLGQCRFYNCHHKTEPDCAVINAVLDGHISKERFELYKQLVHESNQKPLAKKGKLK